ncbi:MBOAT family O-acyltransferase [Aquimarina sp. 2201CG5-10]|uniref:MBOAT family O-acyltransferase n=1 Tax=Aquimarina callyspongiae TaxID=3098150 RepID=UPI002AB4FE99|nr:MBOAT family O-acyltransferase [Aquimarina sp. 2201CG5-10]MDY8137648.1 MBOAT family O-acyltransferase [Aquimarina sp. 2201CG5-10]
MVVILIPLIVAKATTIGFHFENYNSKNIQLLEWFKWSFVFKIIGLSYFTFNGISYLIDIKRKYIQPEKNFFLFLLYLTYFPAIFSGPLHRAKYLINQFKKISISNESISKGLRLILWGLFKNMVIAQRVFVLMNKLIISEISGIYYLILGLLFFLYLYCNFSSFIDLFQGVSKIFGIQLNDNFRNRVYFSSSRQEFWKGWHITLNEWFRDYFFFVLAKKDRKRKYLNLILLTTFILIALWHELTLTLLIWGIMNGLWIILEKKVNIHRLPYPNLRQATGFIYHIFFSCILALIFISSDLFFMTEKIILKPNYFPVEIIQKQYINIIVIISSFIIMDYHYRKAKDERFDIYIHKKTALIRWFIYSKLTLIILIFGINAGVDNYYILF